MYNAEEIKVEYYNACKLSLCHACLSSDRNLSPLGQLAEIYQKICGNPILSFPSNVSLCWECVAALKKMKQFKDKVSNAQRLLTCYHSNQQVFPQCLSGLKITEIDNEQTILLTENEKQTEIKPISIKKELELDDDFDYLDQSNNEYTLIDDIKEETGNLSNKLTKIKKESTHKSKTRKRAYKMVIHPSKPVSDVVAQEKLDPKDLDSWLEKERNSSYFKGLKQKCEKCLCKIRKRDTLVKHNKRYHLKSIGKYSCNICQSYFSKKESLTKHIGQHYIVHHCTECGYKCYSSTHMYKHVESHRKTVQCIHCDACYSNVRKFYSHYKALHCVFICDHCNKKCNTKRILIKHMDSKHNDHEAPECKICNQKFKNRRSLQCHNELKHVSGGGEDAFCVRCDRQFNSVMLYRRHVHTSAAHADERQKIKREKVPCPLCGNVYSRKTYMMNHYRHVHMNQSKHYCVDCDKPFLNRTRYLDHRRYNHEGQVKEKNKLCNICGRGFAANRTLANHMRTHSGERPFVCTYCDSKFTQKQAMLSHIKFIHLKFRRKNSEYVC